MKIYVVHSKQFNFKEELYQPLRQSELNDQHEMILPHESDVFINSHDLIETLDLVIADVSYPSIGVGIELGWAYDAGVPIICIYHKGRKISESLITVSNSFIAYQNSGDLITKLTKYLQAKD